LVIRDLRLVLETEGMQEKSFSFFGARYSRKEKIARIFLGGYYRLKIKTVFYFDRMSRVEMPLNSS